MANSSPVTSRDVSPLEAQDERLTSRPTLALATGATERAPRPSRATRKEVKILFFSANAISGKGLAVDEEHRAIEQSLATSRHRDDFVVIAKLAAREGDLQQALLQHQPDIVHFACHGNVEADLVLLGGERGAAAVSPASLTAMVKALDGKLALVVFNACWSREQAEAIRENVGLAIGMREPIGDGDAIKFASAFYNALGHARSVRNAFDWGVAAIKPKPASRRDVPELFEATSGLASQRVFASTAGRWQRWSTAVVSVIAGSLALGATWWAWPREGSSGPPTGMVRISGASQPRGPGRLNPAQLPAVCRSAQAVEECDAPSSALPLDVRVATFDLDRNEISNREFAAWLNTKAHSWTLAKHGQVMTRQAPSISLALIAPECGGGLEATPRGQIHAADDKSDWPVTCVTWHGANEFCRAQGKRLPLDIEWKLAARGPEGRLFPWGADLPRHDVVAFDLGDGAMKHPRPVGSAPQDVTPQGVHDLGGNVGEWVEDGRGDLTQRTIRGGTWASIGPCHLLGSRCRRKPAESYLADVGFRCARSVLSHPVEREGSP